jgi:type II secretory pathway pseudopilin PulG
VSLFLSSQRRRGFVGLLVLLVLFQAEFADWVLVWVPLLVTGLLCLLALGAYLVFSTKAVPFARWVVTALLASAASVPLALVIGSQQDRLTQKRSARLITALDSYRQQHGRFPDSLAQLGPRYLPRVPTTALGLWRPRPFQYAPWPDSLAGAAAYSLGYRSSTQFEVRYSSPDRRWVYYD